MAFHIWNPAFFALPGQAVFDRDRQHLTTISRGPGNLDLFVIGFDNRVWTTFWNQTAGWNAEFFPLPGQAVFNHETQHIAAVARTPDNLDLFVLGFDNRIWSTFFTSGGGWNGEWFPLPGTAVFDHLTQHVAAVSRAPNNIDLFVLGFDDHAWSTFWTGDHGWHPEPFPLPGGAVFSHQTQQIAALARAPGNLDLFVAGFDNRVWSTFWSEATGWNGDWFQLDGPDIFAHDTQRVAAVSRTPGNLDLFIIGTDDRVWTRFWTAASGWNDQWFPVPGLAVFDHRVQDVSAVSRAPGNLDLFVIGFDDRVWTTFFDVGSGWNAEWFQLPGQAIFDHSRQHLAAVSRSIDNLDVFVLGLDSHAWTTFWGLREPMTLEVTVNQSSSTIPVQVDMHIAATAGIVTETAFVLMRDGIPVPGIGESMPAGLSLDRILAIDVPGAYELIVSRTGFTGPGGPVTLTKQFTIPALSPLDPPPPPPPPPPALTPPVIDAVPFGTVDSALIKVTGTGFLPNRPPAGEPMTQGIGIRMVDFNSLQEIGRDFTSSFADGTVRWEIKELDLRELLAVDAIVTLAISATDGTLNPQDVTGFLWSNTDTVSYLKPQE